jgi:hypothetical protein
MKPILLYHASNHRLKLFTISYRCYHTLLGMGIGLTHGVCLISPVMLFRLGYDKVFSLKQTLIYDSNLILFEFRGLKLIVSICLPNPSLSRVILCIPRQTSYHSELQDQSGHGNLGIGLVFAIFDSFQSTDEAEVCRESSIKSWVIVSLHNCGILTKRRDRRILRVP